jgi:hypothetical protein
VDLVPLNPKPETRNPKPPSPQVDLVVKGRNGKWRTALLHELEKQFEYIIQDSDANPAPEGENAIAALTV